MKLIVANWKANKNIEEAETWAKKFSELYRTNQDLAIVVAPPYHLLSTVRKLLPKEIKLASQDVSFYERGNYTGEVPASTLTGLVDYAIIGHSERRKYLHEADNVIDQKTALAVAHKLKPIVCVRNSKDLIPEETMIVAFEPEGSIGTGDNASLGEVLEMKKTLPLNKGSQFLYGGSVDENSIKEYLKSDEIDGFLIGGASNNPEEFYELITQL